MPSAAEQKRAQFVAVFNQTLGDKIGRPLRYQSDAELLKAAPQSARDAAAVMLAKKLKETKAKTTKDTPGATSSADILKLLGKNSKTKLSSSGINLFGDVPSIDSGQVAEPHRNLLQRGLHNLDTATDNVTDLVKAPLHLGGDLVMRAGDLLSRLDYAGAETMRRSLAAVNRGEDIWTLGNDIGSGAVAGLTGKAKTGWGNVLAENRKPGIHRSGLMKQLLGSGQSLQMAKDANGNYTTEVIDQNDPRYDPSVYKWDDRIHGLIGDVALSPTSHGAAKVGTTVARTAVEEAGRGLGKAIIEGAVKTGKDSLKAETRNIIKNVMVDKGIADTKRVRAGSTVTKNLSTHVEEIANAQIDKMTHELSSGKLIGAGPNELDVLAQTIAEAHRTDLVTRAQQAADRYAMQLKAGKEFSTAERKAIAKRNPVFSRWLDAADEIVKEGKVAVKDIPAEATKRFIQKIDPEIRDIYATTKGKLDNALMRVPTVEFMGRKMYIPKLSGATSRIKGLAGVEEVSAAVNKALRYTSYFPGDVSNIVQKRRVSDMQQLDAFGKQLENLFANTTPEQRKSIHTSIEQGIKLTGREGEIQDQVKNIYKDIYDTEIGRGVRSKAATPPAENYVYNYLNSLGRTHANLDDIWRNPKRLQVRHNGNIDNFTSAEAKARHWNPEQDAGRALLKRKAKSLRKISKVDFKHDLATQYGVRSFISPKAAHEAGMVALDPKQFEQLYKGLKPGERIYLDKNLHKVYNNYLSLMDNSLSKNIFLKSIVSVTKAFKLLNTISFPAYHIKNFLSDIMLSSMDGVTPNKYTQIINAFIHKNTATLKVAGERVPFTRIQHSYLENAAGGFFNTELNYGKTGHILEQSPSEIARRGGNVLAKAGEKREDFGRLTHYWHALDEEMQHQLKKGVPKEQAWKNAEKAATERVNQFLFDYNALTPAEKKIRAYGVPFYTFARKAAPMLTESMFMHPKHFVLPLKLQRALAPSQDYQNEKLPAWMQELGYGELNSSSHVGFTNQLTPGGMLQNIFSKPAAQINPLVQLPFELNSGKDTYSGKPVNGITDYLKNKMRAVSTYRSIESDTKPTVEKWANLFGIPIVQVTPGREGQRKYELEQQVTDKVTALNNKLESRGLKARVTKGKVYLVQPKSPTTDEKSHNKKPRYPVNDKEKIIGVYESFDQLMSVL